MVEQRLSRRAAIRRAWAVAAGSTLAIGGGIGREAVSNDLSGSSETDEVDQRSRESWPIIDTRQHLWDLSRFELPWLRTAGESVLGRSYLTADYLAATRQVHLVQAVYMEVDLAEHQQNAEADYVLDLCRRDDNPTAAAVIAGRPAQPGFATYMERFADNPRIQGVRQVLHGSAPPGYCTGAAFVRGIQLLGEMDKCFDLCLRPGELMDAVRLVDQCPQTRFVLDHCGNGPICPQEPAQFDQWLAGLRELALRPQVMCKISGIVASAPASWRVADLAPVVNESLEAFGEERVMFAGDWPVCLLRASFQQWFEALWQIVQDRSPAFRRKLFHDNAVRFYGLDPRGKQTS